VSTDSRSARKGDLFVAIKGEKFDGHQFVAQAAGNGCCAAIVSADYQPQAQAAQLLPGGVIGVADTTAALAELASFYRGRIAAAVIAVTGSNGKTTCKRMIHHILSRRLTGSCSPKSFNNNIGVPLTLLGSQVGDDYVVCEVGSNAPGEIAALAAIARPDVAVITSVGATHLEKLIDVPRVAVEKASLLGAMDDKGVAIVWADSEHLDKALRQYKQRMIRFGASAGADLRLTGYHQEAHWQDVGAAKSGTRRGGPVSSSIGSACKQGEGTHGQDAHATATHGQDAHATGQRFEINGRLWVKLPMPGRHNAMNALAAIAVAQRMGFTQEQAAGALADFGGTEMRLQWSRYGGIVIINDAYNANPASVLAAADVLSDAAGERRVMVVGDMRELGAGARELHLQTGREISVRKVDMLIGVGELGRCVAEGFAESGKASGQFESVEHAMAQLPKAIRPGDVVLIKGSRAMAMERLIEPLRKAFA
jgi:UDP-N-acetylmuramoyl-tripeptide--D-alanyl-D-alanine ligase